MKQKIAFLFIFIGIILLLMVLSRFIWGEQLPKYGILKVTAEPPVSIFLDNKHYGKAPFEDKISEGEYTIKLVPESVAAANSSWQGKIKISRKLLTYVNAELGSSQYQTAVEELWLEKISSRGSEITVVTYPEGATVSLDGENMGISPVTLTDIEQGEHIIAVSNIGFSPRNIRVRSTPGYKVIVNFYLPVSSGLMSSEKIEESTDSAELNEFEDSSENMPLESIKVSQSPTPKTTLKPTPSIALKSTPAQPTTSDIKKPYVQIEDTPTGFLRVRSEPSTSATESGRVKPGEKYPYVSEKSGWYEIIYESNKNGWVSGQYSVKVE